MLMAFYQSIKYYDRAEQKWIAQHLLELRKCLHDQIQKDRTPNSLIIGSWNIRDFDHGKPRENESYHYIAEILGNFDICAVQEIKDDLKPLKKVMKLLGPNWTYFVSDVTSGDAGNSERFAFLYNKNKISFRNIIGEIVLDKEFLIDPKNPDDVAGSQIARTPFFASFQAGWFRFTLCSTHITFAKNELRRQEIAEISRILSERSNTKNQNEVYVFLGDMNIDSPNNETMKALEKNGMTVPLFGETNQKGDKHFDQIAFTSEGVKTNFLRHDTFDWRCAVFKRDEMKHYKKVAENKADRKYPSWEKDHFGGGTYNWWTTTEMSDHLPIWIELKTDYSDKYLENKFLK